MTTEEGQPTVRHQATIRGPTAEHEFKYRPDIDGLRALAVIAVVLFHAGLSGFGGGFTGVDIFFLISGYLITGIIISDSRLGHLSMLRFYERRVRRILPALVLVLLITYIASASILAPQEMLSASKSVVAAVAFASNLHFFSTGGYFTEASDLKPLLHTWSLAVEEQFYLVFPPFLALLLRWPGAMRPVLIALAAASFALSIWATNNAPLFNFYLPLTRAWELLTGALLAIGSSSTDPARRHNLLAFVGLALLGLPVLLYSSDTPFPGLAALPSVIGAALIIAAGRGSVVGQILSNRVLVYIGLLSYPWYLWHWPVLVLARYANLGPLGSGQTAAAVVVSLALAGATLHFLEMPIRRGIGLRRGTSYLLAGTACAGLLVLGAGGIATQGALFRVGVRTMASDAEAAAAAFAEDPCLLRGESPGSCVVGAGSIKVALWGDSHAAQLVPLLKMVGQEQAFALRRFTKAGCAPILADEIRFSSRPHSDCVNFNRAVWGELIDDPRVTTVIAAATWSVYAEGAGRAIATNYGPNRAGSLALILDKLQLIDAELRRRGGKLIVISQVPAAPADALVCHRTAAFNGWDQTKCSAYGSEANARTRGLVEANLMRPLSARGVQVVDVYDLFCSAWKCTTITNGSLLYLDDEHLSPGGAALLKQRMVRSLSPESSLMEGRD